MTDQLPADIAEAIEVFETATFLDLPARGGETRETARAALDTVILKHIRGDWHPIETLPKDGKKVMLYRPLAGESNDPVVTIRRTSQTSKHCWPDTIPPGCDGQNFTEGSCYATHWMPLPKPPPTDLGRSALADEERGT